MMNIPLPVNERGGMGDERKEAIFLCVKELNKQHTKNE